MIGKPAEGVVRRLGPGMHPLAALEVLVNLRTDRHIVVTNQSPARLWPKLSDHALDFHYNPSAMGGAVPFGLGLALARPACEVLVVTGEGALLMSLGCLVSVMDSGVTNFSVVVMDNGIYEVTGGQKTAASLGEVDMAGFARAAGFPNVSHFWEIQDWRQRGPGVLASRGPRFVWLEVRSARDQYLPELPYSIGERLTRLRAALVDRDL